MSENFPRRHLVLEMLEILSSKEVQIEYERKVPFRQVAAEMVFMWFDDVNIPKLLVSRPKEFTEAGVATLWEFTAAFRVMADHLDRGTIKELQALPKWRDMMASAKQAKEILEKIEARELDR